MSNHMTRPSEAEVTEARNEKVVRDVNHSLKALAGMTKDWLSRKRRATGASEEDVWFAKMVEQKGNDVHAILTAALSTPPLPSAEPVAVTLPGPIHSALATLAQIGMEHRAIGGHKEYGEALRTIDRGVLSLLSRTTPPAAAQDTGRLDAVVEAARKMPRRTPASGGAGTHHTFQISAASVWALDEALTALDAARAAGGE